MRRVNWNLTEQQITKLKELKKLTGLNQSELIRRSIDLYTEQELAKYKKKDKNKEKLV